MAVTKNRSAEEVNRYLQSASEVLGQIPLIGENYLQEFLGKRDDLSEPYECHFIGHLQSNKVKLAAQAFSALQSVDRLSIVKELVKETFDQIPEIYLQVNISAEASKSGLDPLSLVRFYSELPHELQSKVVGLMTIPKAHESLDDLRLDFESMAMLKEQLQQKSGRPMVLSMGMSNDFEMAVECGADLVRIGTALLA